jgi:uncharacterized protein (DUF2267 family)
MPAVEASRLWGEVESQDMLPIGITGADAVTAVLCVLRERLDAPTAHQLVETLPREVRAQLRKRCPRHPAADPAVVDRMPDRMAFHRRVADHLGVTDSQAEHVTRAVFLAVSRRLPTEEILRVASDLPQDLRAVWLNPGSVLPIVALDNNPTAIIFEVVRARAPLPPGKDERDAMSAVMCRLFQRLSRRDAEDVLQELPEGLTAWLKPCAVHHDERAHAFDHAEFLRRVARDLDTTPDAAAEIAMVVFAALRQRLSPREVQDVAAQLPGGLRDLWLGATAVETAPAAHA